MIYEHKKSNNDTTNTYLIRQILNIKKDNNDNINIQQ